MRKAFLTMLLAMAVAGCSIPPSPAGAPAGIRVTDALGRTVEFAELPQRVAIAGRALTIVADAVYLFPEARSRVVAVGRNTQSTAGEFLALVDPAYSEKTLYTVEAGAEQIAPVRPDVVVLKSTMQDRLGRPLEQLGIPVVYVDLETPAQYTRDVAMLGQLFGNPARAGEIEAFYRTRLENLARALEGVSQRPHVLVVQYSEKGGTAALQVPPASWIQTVEVELAGGVPVWKEAAPGGGWLAVNLEQVAVWNPDQVYVIDYRGDPGQAVARITSDPQWQGLEAVQTGQVHAFPKDYYSWDQPNPRWILGVTWLAGKLHPDRFPNLDMTAEAIQFFAQLYSLDETTVREQILPRIQGDLDL